MTTRGGGASASRTIAHLEDCCPEVGEAMRLSLVEVPGGAAATEEDVTCDPAGWTADAPDLCWGSLVLGDIPGLSELVDAVATPLEVVAAVLKFIAGVLDIISKFLLALPDPWQALIMAAYTLLKEIIDDFLNSGAYLYADAPGITSNWVTLQEMGLEVPFPESWTHGADAEAEPYSVEHLEGWADTGLQGLATPDVDPSPDGFERWAARFKASFDDPGDGDRPVFSDGADVSAVFVVATAPQLTELRPILDALGEIFDLQPFKDAWKKFETEWPDPDRSRLRLNGTAPDWIGFRLGDIAPGADYPLRKLELVPWFIKNLLLNVDNLLALLKDLIEVVQDKVALMLELVEILQGVIEMIRALEATGFHYLAVITNEGVEGLQRAFIEAGNRPGTFIDPDAEPDEQPAQANAVAGICLLSGTTGALPLWSLLGAGGDFSRAWGSAEEGTGFLGELGELEEGYEQARKDTEALAKDLWEGTNPDGSTPEELGLSGLWGEAFDEEEGTVLEALGLTEEEADEQANADRNALIAALEAAGEEGLPLSPQALAHIEATRRARRRGRRSLAMRHGTREER